MDVAVSPSDQRIQLGPKLRTQARSLIFHFPFIMLPLSFYIVSPYLGSLTSIQSHSICIT